MHKSNNLVSKPNKKAFNNMLLHQ